MKKEEPALAPPIFGALTRFVHLGHNTVLDANVFFKHMNHTQGWEYSDSAITGSGALAATSNRDDNRRSKRLSSAARQQRDGNEMAEFGSRPAASRRHSSSTRQATARGGGAVADPEMASADRSRSRSQRGGDAESDFERQSDQEHQRRLREVRGLHRKRTNDQ